MQKAQATKDIMSVLRDPEAAVAAVNRLADFYQRTACDRIVAERGREKERCLPQAQREEYLRQREQEITFQGCECIREINGGLPESAPTRLLEFTFSDYTPGTVPLANMRIRLRTVSGVERWLIYQGHHGNRVTVEIDMESHLMREMQYITTGDIVEFLLPYKTEGKETRRFRYLSADTLLSHNKPAIFKADYQIAHERQLGDLLPKSKPAVFETLDGSARCTLPAWKQRLFWIAEREGGQRQAHGFSDNSKKKVSGLER